MIRVSRCCSPVPGDKIIGYITRGRGVSVHRQDCVNVSAYISDPEEKARLIDVSWASGIDTSYVANLKLICNDRDGLVVETVNIINDMKLPLKAVNGRAVKGNACLIEVSVALNNTADLAKLITKLQRIPDVIEVTRT